MTGPQPLNVTSIAARATAATPGPWVAVSDNGRRDGIALVGAADDRGTGRAIAVFSATGGRRNQDAQFTAAARTDVPALVAEVHRLREQAAEIAARLRAAQTWAEVQALQAWLEDATAAAPPEATPPAPGLTPAQRRILAEVLAIPGRAYNGRFRAAIDALEAAGLVSAVRETDPTNESMRITVRPTADARAYLTGTGG